MSGQIKIAINLFNRTARPLVWSVFVVNFVVVNIISGQYPDLHFNHLSLASGLSQSINAFVFQDSRGFVWISSTDGLNRYDGVGIRVYRSQPGDSTSFHGENIQSNFFEDETGDLWFGTSKALVRYRRATDDFQHFQCPDSTGKEAPMRHHVFYREGRRLWVCAGGNFFLVDYQKLKRGISTREASKYAGRLPNKSRLRCFVRPSQQGYFDIFSTCYGVIPGISHYRLENDSLRQVAHRTFSDKQSDQTNCLLFDGADTLWVATGRGLGLYRISTGKLTFPQAGPLVLRDYARHIVAWGDRFLFVSGKDGLYLFDKQLGGFAKKYTHNESEPSTVAKDFAMELYLDDTETLWLSQWMIGLDFAQLRKNKFEKIRLPVFSDQPQGPVFIPRTMCEDLNGNLWLGSNVHGLKVVDRNFRTVAAPDVETNNIEKIFQTPDGNIWILPSGSMPKVFEYRNRKHIPAKATAPPDTDFDMMAIVDKSQIWLHDDASNTIFEARQAGRSWQIWPLPSSILASGNYGFFFEDKSGNLWMAENDNSIGCFRKNNGRYERTRTFSAEGEVMVFAETSEHIWAGGRFGLLRLPKADNAAARLFTQTDGLPNETVYAVLADREERLWLSTNRGIVRFTPQDGKFRAYSLADGLQDFEFNQNAFLQMSDGSMLFGGVRGFNRFHPGMIQNVVNTPKVGLLNLKVNDEPFDLERNIAELDTLILKYFQNTFSVEFSALEYSDPANNHLEYRLSWANGKDYDKDWIACKDASGFARYANLRPGQYILRIIAFNSDGERDEHPRELYISVTPPFWQTWWFRALCMLALAGAIYAGVRVYIRNQLREKNLQLREQRLQIEKQEALTQERNRIAGEMHDDLGGGLTSIRMLSSRVQKKITNPDLQTQVDKIAQYSQELVQKMGEIIWAMNSNFDTVENLIAYIRRYAVDFLDVSGLRYHIREPEEVPGYAISGERRRNIYLAVKESLHNVVKHAKAERVSISFDIKDEQLTVQVQDDGEGIDLEKINEFGNGLFNMRKRLRDIGGDMLVENLDGTLLTFTIPLEKSEAS